MTRSIGRIHPDSRRPGGVATGRAALVAGGALLLMLSGAVSAGESSQDASKKKQPAKPSGAPAAVAAEGAGGKPPVPAAPAPLSFTDEDLDRYHRPRPEAASADETGEEDSAEPPASAAAPLPKKAPAPRAIDLKRSPPNAARPPAEDPLKSFQDRDAREAFRKEQLSALRERIETLQSRLEYLKAKETGILNPGPVQAGRTVGPDYGADGKPDISPGRPQPKLAPIFPALPPPQNDQDRVDDKSLKLNQLLEKVKAEIESVNGELDQAKRELVTIETRFALEASGR